VFVLLDLQSFVVQLIKQTIQQLTWMNHMRWLEKQKLPLSHQHNTHRTKKRSTWISIVVVVPTHCPTADMSTSAWLVAGLRTTLNVWNSFTRQTTLRRRTLATESILERTNRRALVVVQCC
jgi:hypothetical protein